MAKTAAACSAYPAGAAGVLGVYCNGRAAVDLTVNGVVHHLAGGVCSTSGGALSLNLGVKAGPDLAGPRPDYVGLTAPAEPGLFVNAPISVAIDGKAYRLSQTLGQITPTGGSFQGVARRGRLKVTANFSC